MDVSVVENLLECKVSELMLHFDEPPIKELVRCVWVIFINIRFVIQTLSILCANDHVYFHSRILQSAELTTVFLKMLSSAVTPQFLRHQVRFQNLEHLCIVNTFSVRSF